MRPVREALCRANSPPLQYFHIQRYIAHLCTLLRIIEECLMDTVIEWNVFSGLPKHHYVNTLHLHFLLSLKRESTFLIMRNGPIRKLCLRTALEQRQRCFEVRGWPYHFVEAWNVYILKCSWTINLPCEGREEPHRREKKRVMSRLCIGFKRCLWDNWVLLLCEWLTAARFISHITTDRCASKWESNHIHFTCENI